MIRFLIKSVFWLSLAFIVMPQLFPAGNENTSSQHKDAVREKSDSETVEQMLANGKTALEIGKLCINNPAICENGTSLVSSAASGMLERSGSILEFLSDRFGNKPPDTAPITPEPPLKQQASIEVLPQSLSKIPIPTPRAEALRALDRSTTGAIRSAN